MFYQIMKELLKGICITQMSQNIVKWQQNNALIEVISEDIEEKSFNNLH